MQREPCKRPSDNSFARPIRRSAARRPGRASCWPEEQVTWLLANPGRRGVRQGRKADPGPSFTSVGRLVFTVLTPEEEDIMGGIVLRILLDGLNALVPSADNSSFFTALVNDGTHPPIEASTCVAPHMATLQFTFAGDQALACTNLGCKVSGSTCTCT